MLFVLVEFPVLDEPELKGCPMVADAPPGGTVKVLDVLFVLVVPLVLFVPVVLVAFVPMVSLVVLVELVPVEVELVPEVALLVVLPDVLLEVDSPFMPEVGPGTLPVVVLPDAELPTIWPPGPMVTGPTVVDDALPAEPVVLVAFVPAVVELVLVTSKGVDSMSPSVSAASMSICPLPMVDGMVTVALKLPLLLEVTFAASAVCPSIKRLTLWFGSKPLPLTVTWLPAGPEVGDTVSRSFAGWPATELPVAVELDVAPDVEPDVEADVTPATVKVASMLTVKVFAPRIS